MEDCISTMKRDWKKGDRSDISACVMHNSASLQADNSHRRHFTEVQLTDETCQPLSIKVAAKLTKPVIVNSHKQPCKTALS